MSGPKRLSVPIHVPLPEGIPENEPESEYQAKRLEVEALVRDGKLRLADLTPQIRWYLSSEQLQAMYNAATREELPSAAFFEVPLPRATIARIDRGQLEQTEALKIVQQWYLHLREGHRVRRKTLVLCGGTGIGKTVAAAWVLRRARSRGRYVKARDLVRLHRANFGEDRTLYRECIRCALLVIDEVGGEYDLQRERVALHDTIDDRQGKSTLLISNLTTAGFEARLDARTVDRLTEVGAIRTVGGDSMRGDE